MHGNHQWLTALLLRIHNKFNHTPSKEDKMEKKKKNETKETKLNNNGKCCVGLNFGRTLPCLPLLGHPWTRAPSHLGRGDTKQQWGAAAWPCAHRDRGALRRKCLWCLTHLLLGLRTGCSGFSPHLQTGIRALAKAAADPAVTTSHPLEPGLIHLI